MTDRDHIIGEFQLQQVQRETWPGEGYIGHHIKTQQAAFLHHLSPDNVPPEMSTSTGWQALQQQIPALLALHHEGLLGYKRCLGPTDREIWLMRPHIPPPSPNLPHNAQALLTSQTPGKLNERNALQLYSQIKQALDYLHQRGLYHGALSLDALHMDWQQRPPAMQIAQSGLCVPDVAREQRPEGQRAFLMPTTLMVTHEYTALSPLQQGQWRDRYALGGILWRMVTATIPPPEPPFRRTDHNASPPWEWPLAEPPSRDLLQVWRESFAAPTAQHEVLSPHDDNAETLVSGLVEHSGTLPLVGHASPTAQGPSSPTWQAASSLPPSLSKTIPYEEGLQEAIANALQASPELHHVAPQSTTDKQPSKADHAEETERDFRDASATEHLDDLPAPIPEEWEQEAILIDARLDRRSRGGRHWGLWLTLLLLLFVGWLWRSLGNK